MRRFRLLGALLALAIVTGCSGGDKPPPNNEDDFARSMLLDLDDFPAGWVEAGEGADRGVDEPGTPIQRCATQEGRTGRASSPDFAPAPGASTITETIVVFDDKDAALAAIDQTAELVACAINALNNGELDSDGLSVSAARAEELELSTHGDASRAYLTFFELNPSDEETYPVYSLAVYGARGRIGFNVVLQTGVEPPSEAIAYFESMVDIAVAKLRDQP